jgi:hypothetical protein
MCGVFGFSFEKFGIKCLGKLFQCNLSVLVISFADSYVHLSIERFGIVITVYDSLYFELLLVRAYGLGHLNFCLQLDLQVSQVVVDFGKNGVILLRVFLDLADSSLVVTQL